MKREGPPRSALVLLITVLLVMSVIALVASTQQPAAHTSKTSTTSLTPTTSTLTGINDSSGSCDLLSLNNKEATASTPMSQQEAIGVARSSSQYQAITAGAATVNFTGMPDGWILDQGNCTASLQFLAVDFDMHAINGSSYAIVIQVNPYSGAVVGARAIPLSG